ncbi:High-affinity zinc uptake system ATP-binding protein ZnuC [termite gut metagenome]|uniref:High-affinity zinc uptake system ATP-binding protein ZnuC n=1 Tax=termite gut metagenome TaxID=433724 RepID=A0A5J4SQL4_9ZZZZ
MHVNITNNPSSSPEEDILIAIRNLSVAYDGHIVLRDVHLAIHKYDFLGVAGPNGGGKTTLIKAILGLLKPAGKGEICFYKEGIPVKSVNMGYLPQYNNLDRKFPISVREILLSGLSSNKSLIGRFTQAHQEKVCRMITRMGLEGLEDRTAGQLSGGQLQRALLGRAIISEPQIVILDEPDTYIDKQFATHLYELLEEINKDCAIILISHNIDTLTKYAKTIVYVNETIAPFSTYHK